MLFIYLLLLSYSKHKTSFIIFSASSEASFVQIFFKYRDISSLYS